jgi:hypothetical protein
MASFEGSIGTPDGRFNMMVEYSISQSIENNYSDITATGYVKRNVSSVYPYNGYGGDGVLTIDGDSKSETVPYDLRSDGYKQIMSHSKRVYHNSDGTKGITISFSFNGNLSSYYPNGSISQYITLPTIARASEIACSSPYIGDTAIINISKKSSNFKSTVWYTFGNLNNTIATKTSENVISFNTNSVKSQLYSQIQNSQSGSGTMYCETFNGNTSIGTKSCTFYLYAKESDCKPNLTVTVVDTNSDVTALLGSNTKFLRYLSKPQVTLIPTAKYSSSITNYTISANNENHNNSTYTFNTLENNTITGYVKDSRGFTKTVTETLDMIDYIKLHINNFDVSRPEGLSTQAILNIDGAWYNDDFTTNLSNTLTMQLSYKLSSANTWTTYGTLNPTLTGNTFKITNLSLSGTYDVDEEYQFKIVISDEIDGMEQIETLHKGQEIISIGDEKVWLYGDLFINDYKMIDSGSNNNGKYIKFFDGTLICYGVVNNITTPANDGISTLITLPISFINTNYNVSFTIVNGTAYWASVSTSVNSKNTNNFMMYTWNEAGSDNSNQSFSYIAIGKWK